MKISWLNKSGNNSLILFFSGWSIYPKHLTFLDCSGYDVAVIHSYNSFDLKKSIQLEKYKEVNALIYSFGVSIGAHIFSKINFRGNVFAINGTCKPVDNRFGIRKMVFEKTLENLNSDTFIQFQKNMFDNENEYSRFSNSLDLSSDIELLRHELTIFRDFSESIEIQPLPVKKVLISKNDKIFFPKNQIDFWKDFNYEIIDSGHFPFYKFLSWGEIIKTCSR